jgi:hypothetical protein
MPLLSKLRSWPGRERTRAWRRPALVAVLGIAAAAAVAAPVDASTPATPAPAAAELALRWTLTGRIGLGGSAPPSPAVADASPAPPEPTTMNRLPAAGTDAGVPDPAAYALMGLLLVGAGLAARHWRRGAAGDGDVRGSKAARPHRGQPA